MEFTPGTFAGVSLGTYAESPCSPRTPPGNWTGVLIDAPRQIRLDAGEHPVIPVCGVFLVPVLAAMDGPPLTLSVRAPDLPGPLVAIVQEPAANEPELPPPAGAPRADRDALKGVQTGGWFNLDAQAHLPIALGPGRIEVIVTYAGFQSNPVQIDLSRP